MSADLARAYRVIVTSEDGQWLADVPALAGAHTFASTLPALERHVREVIVLAEGLPQDAADSITLDLEFHPGGSRRPA